MVAPLLMISLFDPGFSPATVIPAEAVQQPNVNIHFAWFHWGVVIVVGNGEEESIYNICLESIDIAGFVILGSGWIDYIKEIGSYSVGYLIIPTFGIGRFVVTATVSYEYEGKTYNETLHGFFFVFGSTTFLLEEW